jgi:hypothetical protein
MTVYIANVDLTTDTFEQWVEKTNYLIQAMSNVVISTTSNVTIGSAVISGDFNANSLSSSNTGYLRAGQNTSNTVISPTVTVIQSSSTTNNVITSTGMLIDGVTQYSKTFTTIGNTTISGSSVAVDNITVVDSFRLGNTAFTISTANTEVANTLNLNVANSASFGDNQANVVINRDGISVYANPSGNLVVNSYMTSTDLYIDNIYTKKIAIIGASSNTTFSGNVFFYGSNNYFATGFSSNGDVTFNNSNGVITFNSWTLFNASNNYFVRGLTSANTITTSGAITAYDGLNTFDYVKFYGLTSGFTALRSNTVSGSTVFTLPVSDGAAGDIMFTDGSGRLGFKAPFSGNNTTDFTIRDITARSIGVGTSAAGVSGDIRAAGNITAYYSSDQRLKENVVNISNALTKVQSINGVEFDWTDAYITQHGGFDGTFMRKHDVGVIAQQIEAVLPEVVMQRSDGYKAVKYEKIIALLIEAIKELKAEVDSLKNGN